jgi:glycerol-3-phosphate dehydrogenase (NAD(P)+)
MSSVVVIGAGAWGTALAVHAARAGNKVTLWARDSVRAGWIAANRENARLPGVRLPEAIKVTALLPVAAEVALIAVPTQQLRSVLRELPAGLSPLVICAKGVEQATLRLPLEIVAEVRPAAAAAILTGPTFAHEIAAGLPAAAVVAATDATLRERIAGLLGTRSFRLYGNDDPIGAQVGGAAKNVIAIAAGAVIGAGLGENARAALIARGLAELARLAVALGGRAEIVTGLSGLGDLLLTCTGSASRNYSLGVALGRGDRLADVLAARTAVTEGVTTAPALVARAAGVDLPICTAVASVLAGDRTLSEEITDLLARPRRDE